MDFSISLPKALVWSKKCEIIIIEVEERCYHDGLAAEWMMDDGCTQWRKAVHSGEKPSDQNNPADKTLQLG